VRIDELRGHVVHIGAACGAQFAGGRDLVLRVSRAVASTRWDGMAFITGDVLNANSAVIGHRELYVQVAELNFVTPVPGERVDRRRDRDARPVILLPGVTPGAPRTLIGARR